MIKNSVKTNNNDLKKIEKLGIKCDFFSFIFGTFGVIFSILSLIFLSNEKITLIFTCICIAFDIISVMFAISGFYFGFIAIKKRKEI